MTTPTITVQGEAVVRADPDEAVVWITLDAVADAPGDALSDVARRSADLQGVLDDLGVAASERSTTTVAVAEDFDHTEQGRRSLGHRAASTVSVRLTDHAVIGELVSRVTGELQAHVAGPRWQIAQDNPVRLEAARQAATHGARKAEAYAEGVGARLGELLSLREPEGAFTGVRMMSGGARLESAMAIDPGEHEVAAAVEVTFALKSR